MALEKFRLYEVWIAYWSFSFLFSLIYCYHWKIIVIPFLFVQAFFGLMIFIMFKEVDLFIYTMILFSMIVYPFACMVNAKIFFDILKITQK